MGLEKTSLLMRAITEVLSYGGLWTVRVSRPYIKWVVMGELDDYITELRRLNNWR